MKIRYYKINYTNTNIAIVDCNSEEERELYGYTEKKKYYRNFYKAKYNMFMNRLKKESDRKRQNKLKLKINEIIEEYPEVVF